MIWFLVFVIAYLFCLMMLCVVGLCVLVCLVICWVRRRFASFSRLLVLLSWMICVVDVLVLIVGV